jgi:5'-3' exonuclease
MAGNFARLQDKRVKKMAINEKMVMQCQIDILSNALDDILFLLTEIDGYEDTAPQAIIARCAYARGQNALRNSSDRMEGFKNV